MKSLIKFIGLALLTLTMAFTSVDKKVIVIDVSHGGKDNGTMIDEFKEKDISLSIANKIKALNKNSNIEIILTRDGDQFVTLNERTQQINALKPDMVISLHTNAHQNQHKNGIEIFISDDNQQKEKSHDLALRLSDNFKDQNVEIKKAGFYLLKNVEYPIALVELGFLTNENDRQVLTSEKGQIAIAEKLLKVLQ
jgi:N-acetylmuramoyl-L-alanine amidase